MRRGDSRQGLPLLERSAETFACRQDGRLRRLRAVIAEASLLHAVATREEDLAAFFANANGTGERIEVIPPMRRVNFLREVVAPRSALR